MSLHKFDYSSEQLKLGEYQDPNVVIKSQGELAQIPHSKLKEENELEKLAEDQKN